MKRSQQLPSLEERENAARVLRGLRRLFPRTRTFLDHSNAWELLVAVMLSAQCTDARVNIVTKDLFQKYPHLDDYVNADPQTFEKDIYSTGFYRAKTKNVLAAAHVVKQEFHGKIPRTMKEMLRIPGVGRKTANVVLGTLYGVHEGIAVDTHVKRLVRVFGITRDRNPEKIERTLMGLFPKREWWKLTYRFIEYGRTYCPARRHDHTRCPLGHFDGRN